MWVECMVVNKIDAYFEQTYIVPMRENPERSD